ncbi:uncharacterized protein TrAFT101_006005 [Trichoderma asperellum]|uniref:uncharacterized protein n=1 Tax=Trichoderma asperellum TaxID=101201 RepID=UPI003329DB6C|nr:hypothetical protein TrAFT101_006005 [Trichoderma asperellum]
MPKARMAMMPSTLRSSPIKHLAKLQRSIGLFFFQGRITTYYQHICGHPGRPLLTKRSSRQEWRLFFKASRDSPNDRAAISRAGMEPKDLAAAEIHPPPLAFPVMILFLV